LESKKGKQLKKKFVLQEVQSHKHRENNLKIPSKLHLTTEDQLPLEYNTKLSIINQIKGESSTQKDEST